MNYYRLGQFVLSRVEDCGYCVRMNRIHGGGGDSESVVKEIINVSINYIQSSQHSQNIHSLP